MFMCSRQVRESKECFKKHLQLDNIPSSCPGNPLLLYEESRNYPLHLHLQLLEQLSNEVRMRKF